MHKVQVCIGVPGLDGGGEGVRDEGRLGVMGEGDKPGWLACHRDRVCVRHLEAPGRRSRE